MKRFGWILYIIGMAWLLLMVAETLNRPDRYTVRAIEFFAGGACAASLFLVPGVFLLVWARHESWKREQRAREDKRDLSGKP